MRQGDKESNKDKIIHMKINIIKVIILIIMLTAVTVVFYMQDAVISIVLSNDTLIRNGQRLEARLETDDGEQITISAETPYYSIYEYNIHIPADVWKRTQNIRFEIFQVRRDDNIYIESVSVKKPLFQKYIFNNDILYPGIDDITAADLSLTNNNLLNLKVTATRAHTPDMSTEGPSFSIPVDALNANHVPGAGYIICILLTILLWVALFLIVPKKTYIRGIAYLRDLVDIMKHIGAVDIGIILSGISALTFNFYGKTILPEYSETAYNMFSFITILLITIKIISNNGETLIKKRTGSIFNNKWIPYIVLLILSLAVYIPAIFPNPYFNNDEHQVIGAAEWYLANGNYERYSRAWPHTWMVAQAIRFFGLSTVSTRAVSALWGVIFILSAYHITKQISKQKNIAFLTALMLLFVPTGIFAITRMYAVMLPISLWLFYCIYMTLHKEIIYKRDNILIRVIKRNFNFHFGYAAASIFLIWFNFNIHTNSMMIVFCAAVYVFIIAIFKRERKFVVLSVIGIGIIVLSLIGLTIPMIAVMMRRLVAFGGGLGIRYNYNYNYFWSNIRSPLGTYFGITLLLISFGISIRKWVSKREKENAPYNLYHIILYIISIIFFVYIGDRYYSYVYMSFLLPITIILIATATIKVTTMVNLSTRLAIWIIVAGALIMQMSSTFSSRYIDNSSRTKFDRPYQMIVNDAKNEELEIVTLTATFARSYFREIVNNGDNIGGPNNSRIANQIDYLLEKINFSQAIVYFFSESSKMFHVSETYGEFLRTAANFVTDIDASQIYKYHFVNAELANIVQGKVSDEANNTDTFNITDVQWENDTTNLICEMNIVSEFDNALFVALEVVEQGIAQTATHRYQVLLPENFTVGDKLEFTLPLRPKTEEYSENIVFTIANWAYAYYGMDKASVFELME